MVNNYHLKYFVDAVKSRSLTQAAKENSVSVAAISQAIKNLEVSVQIKLIAHQKNRLNLTPEGVIFFERSQEFLKDIKRFHQDIDFTSKIAIGKISFATQQSFASVLLPELLLTTKKKFPKIRPHFQMGTTNYVKQWVENEEVDFGISLDNVSFKNSYTTPIFDGDFVCIKKKGVKKNLKFLTTEDTRELKEFKKLYREHFHQNTPIEMVVGSWGVIAKLALKGIGIGFIPDYYLWNLPKEDYSIHRLPFALPKYRVNAYTLKNKTLSPQGMLFIQEFIEVAKKLKAQD